MTPSANRTQLNQRSEGVASSNPNTFRKGKDKLMNAQTKVEDAQRQGQLFSEAAA